MSGFLLFIHFSFIYFSTSTERLNKISFLCFIVSVYFISSEAFRHTRLCVHMQYLTDERFTWTNRWKYLLKFLQNSQYSQQPKPAASVNFSHWCKFNWRFISHENMACLKAIEQFCMNISWAVSVNGGFAWETEFIACWINPCSKWKPHYGL